MFKEAYSSITKFEKNVRNADTEAIINILYYFF